MDDIVPPPASRSQRHLPLESIDWSDFELLLADIAETELNLREVRRYGIRGQKQYGLDIIGYDSNSSIVGIQSKAVQNFTPSELEKSWREFSESRPQFACSTLVIAIRCDASSSGLIDKFTNLKREADASGVEFRLWGSAEIEGVLYRHPDVVERYFGIEHANSFCVGTAPRRKRRLANLKIESHERCVARWTALGISDQEAEEFANDPNAGAIPISLKRTEKKMIGIIGDFGSGKSLIAERVHQSDIAEAEQDPKCPLPVLIHARHIHGKFSQNIIAETSEIGDVRTVGARIIIDGLDECPQTKLSDLRQQAQVISRSWPHTSVIYTARPVHGIPEDNSIHVPNLTLDEANALIERVSKRSNIGFYTWPKSIQESTRRPIFALSIIHEITTRIYRIRVP